jgi:Arc/MetJ family transcription regulator
MRTNINLDDDLLAQVAEIAGTTTKTSTVEYALREIIRRHAMRELSELRIDLDEEAVRPNRERSRRSQRATA